MARAFPIVYAADVETSARFYERLGFERHFQLPPDGDAGYVGLRMGASELAVVSVRWPSDTYGLEHGRPPVFELFVYVDDPDALVERLASDGTDVLRRPEPMPWGERVGFVRDPDGNPVALASERADRPPS